MGNELAKRYDMPKTHTASGGHDCLWKIYQATAKATGEQVSVFVLDIEELSKGPLSKAEREQVLDICRKDIRALREMNHPNVLRIFDVLEENKKLMAFVCERVMCSMANALHRFKNLPTGQPIATEISEYRISEMELGRGIAHLCDALQYTHYVARRLHLGIAPEAIFITPQGVWKLGGFGQSISLSPNEVGPRMQTLCPYYQSNASRRAGPYRLEPHLAYTAPEITTVGTSRISYSADAFSLACVIYEAFQMPLLVGVADVSKPLIDVNDLSSPQDQLSCIQRMYPVSLSRGVPADPGLRDTLERLLAFDPTHRPEAITLTQCSFFHSGAVATLRELDLLCGKDPGGQATFLSSLADKLALFPPRLQRLTVLPPVLSAAHANPALWLYAVPLVIKVSEVLSDEAFASTVQEGLQAAYNLRPANPQVMFLLGQHTPLLLQRAHHSFFIQHVYPMMLLGLESGVPQLQDQVIKQIGDDKMAQAITSKRMLDDVLPRLGLIIVQTTHVSVRVNALVCISKTHRCYGKQVLIDAILPTLKVCLEKDQNPAVVMCVLGCYDVLVKEIEPEYVCTHIVPVLAPMIYLPTLTSSQFDKVSSRVTSMLSKAIQVRKQDINARTGGTGTTSTQDSNGSLSPVSFMTTNVSASSLTTTMATPEDDNSGAPPTDAGPLKDWSWLKPLAASAASSATNLLANATTTITTTVMNGVATTKHAAGGLDSSGGGGIKYDSSSNPYQLPGTEFSLPSSTSKKLAASSISNNIGELSSYKPPPSKPPTSSSTSYGTATATAAGFGSPVRSGSSGSLLSSSSSTATSGGGGSKFDRQSSGSGTLAPLAPVTMAAPAPPPAPITLSLDFMASSSSSSTTKGGKGLSSSSGPSGASSGAGGGANMFQGLSPPRQAKPSAFTRAPSSSSTLGGGGAVSSGSSQQSMAALGPLQPIVTPALQQQPPPARQQQPGMGGIGGGGGGLVDFSRQAPLMPIVAAAPATTSSYTPQTQQYQYQQQQAPSYPSSFNATAAPTAYQGSSSPSLDLMSAFDSLGSAMAADLPTPPPPQQQQQQYGAGGGNNPGGMMMMMTQPPQQQQQHYYYHQQQQQQQGYSGGGASGFDFMR